MYFIKIYSNYDFSIQYFTEHVKKKKILLYYYYCCMAMKIMFSFSVPFFYALNSPVLQFMTTYIFKPPKKYVYKYYNKKKYVENCFVQISNIYMAFHTTTLKKRRNV